MFNKNIFNVVEHTNTELWTLEEIKNYLRISYDYDDVIIKNLIISATEAAENYLGLSLNSKTIEFISNSQNKRSFNLKYDPIYEILKVCIIKGEDEKDLNPKDYYLNKSHSTFHINKNLAGKELKVMFSVGYESSKLPYAIRQGILLHICEMYDKDNDNHASLTNAIRNLYSPYKKIRI